MSEQAAPHPIDLTDRAVEVLRRLDELKSDEPIAASGRDRLLARMIDFGLICAAGVVAGVIAGVVTLLAYTEDGATTNPAEIDPSNPAAIATRVGVVALIVVVEIAMLARWGRTPGKRFMGLTVVDAETGGRPSLWQAAVRTCMWGIPAALAAGLWWAAAISWVFVLAVIGSWALLFWSRRRQAGHDLLSGTRVMQPR